MDNKEAIIQVTIELIRENGEDLGTITVREICKRANVGLGLVNYHFGNKDKLMEVCVERIVGSIVEKFLEVAQKTEGLNPFEKLDHLGNMTLDFLFSHDAVSHISMLGDMQNPKVNDNIHRTYAAYLPLVAACRPDWDEQMVKRKTFALISVMEQSFLRHEAISATFKMNLRNQKERRAWHRQILQDILEVRV